MATPTTPISVGVDVQELAKEYGWSPSRGYFTKRQWKGKEADIKALIPQLLLYGYDYIVSEGPVWSVTATINQDVSDGNNDAGTTEIPYPQFEMFAERREVNLFESTSPICTALRPELVRAVQKDCEENEIPTFLGNPAFSEAEKSAAMDLYLHYITGAKGFSSYTPILRKSYSISNNYQIAADTLYGANFIWTTNAVISTEGVPFALQGIMAPSSEFVVNTGGGQPGISMLQGWLKGYPTYNQIATNRFQVNVDYTYGTWPKKVYWNGFIA